MPATLEDIAVEVGKLGVSQAEVCKDTKAMLEVLTSLNGRIRNTEERTATLWERVDNHHSIIRIVTGVMATVAGSLIIAGAIKVASLF